jgi:hypothetical protein
MTSNITASNNIASIADRVMLRQLTPVPREQVEALVKMVLECAAEAAPDTREMRILSGWIMRVETAGGRQRAIFAAEQTGTDEPLNLNPVTPLLTTAEGQDLAARLNELVGKRVTFGLGREVEGRMKLLVIRTVEADE